MNVYDEFRSERERHASKGYDAEHDREHGLSHILIHAKGYITTDRDDLIKAGSMIAAAVQLIDGDR